MLLGDPIWESIFAPNPSAIFFAAGLLVIYLGLRLLFRQVLRH